MLWQMSDVNGCAFKGRCVSRFSREKQKQNTEFTKFSSVQTGFPPRRFTQCNFFKFALIRRVLIKEGPVLVREKTKSHTLNFLWPKIARLAPLLNFWLPKSAPKCLCGSLFCCLSQERRHINFLLRAQNGGLRVVSDMSGERRKTMNNKTHK